MNKTMLRASLFILAFAALSCFAPPSHAQGAQDSAPQAVPAAPGADDGQGDDETPDPFKPRPDAGQQTGPRPAPKPPADAPQLEKRGEDLIVHGPGGDTQYAFFLQGLKPGEQRPITIMIPNRGTCVLQVDFNGALVSMTCEK